MLQEAFERIMDEYPIAREQEFANHPLAMFIRQEIPELLNLYLPDKFEIIWHASAGQGRWADAPWIAAFDQLVTNSAQSGYYPVYLFTRSLDSVYLSLNQGMTEIRKEFGAQQTRKILGNRASGSVGTELAIMSGKKSTQKRQGEANDQTQKRPTTHIDRRRTGLVGADQPFTQ